MNKGFTLIELILTVSIVTVIALLSLGFYSRFYLQNSVANTEDSLTGTLRKAQVYTMMGKQNGVWGVHLLSGSIVLFQGATYAGRNSAFDEKTNIDSTVAISGYSDITFARLTGTPSGTPTVNITGANNTKTMTINSQGVVNK